MSRLTPCARAYLKAAGFVEVRAEADFLQMERPASDGRPAERFLIWSDDSPRPSSGLGGLFRGGRETDEKHLLERFAAEMQSAQPATGFFLVESRHGLTQSFITEATQLLGERGGIRVPVEFFDAPYRIDSAEARRARSALADLLTKAEKWHRVSQPYFVRRGLGPETRKSGKGDLVAFLEKALSEHDPAPKVFIIEGNAGSGKTVAFNALVASLYRNFIDAKRARRDARRPVVFLPAHLRSGGVGYVDDVIAAMAHTDVADVTSPEQMRWLLLNGYALWMFDGLDEFYDGSPDFFTFIEEALSAPGSKARFIICTRDSLLSSNAALRKFIEQRVGKGATVEVFDLAPWTKEAWREMASLELGRRSSGASSKNAADFVAAVEKSPEMSSLASLPFYCSLLIERFKRDGALPKDEFDALEFLVDRMIDREHGKDIFRWRDYIDLERLSHSIEDEISRRRLPMPPDFDARAVVRHLLDREGRDILFELVGSIAHKHRRENRADDETGLATEDLRQLSGLGNVPINLNNVVVKRLQTAMVQFAFFGPGRVAGTVDFTHQITADYLAAHYAAALLRRDLQMASNGNNGLHADAGVLTRAMRNAVGSVELAPHSLFCRALAREIHKDPALDRLFRALRDEEPAGRSRADAVLSMLTPA